MLFTNIQNSKIELIKLQLEQMNDRDVLSDFDWIAWHEYRIKHSYYLSLIAYTNFSWIAINSKDPYLSIKLSTKALDLIKIITDVNESTVLKYEYLNCTYLSQAYIMTSNISNAISVLSNYLEKIESVSLEEEPSHDNNVTRSTLYTNLATMHLRNGNKELANNYILQAEKINYRSPFIVLLKLYIFLMDGDMTSAMQLMSDSCSAPFLSSIFMKGKFNVNI